MSDDVAPPEAPAADVPAHRHELRVKLPGDWVAIDTAAVARFGEQAGELPPATAAAARLLASAAEAFRTQGTLLSAILAERGSLQALATLACFVVGMPELPAEVDLAERLRASPPRDAVEDTFEVDEDEAAGGRLRARCLRRSVLGVPTRDSVSLSVEYFLQIEGGGMLVAAFTTPNAAEEDDYLALFSKIAATVEIAA